jgi:hemerythrin-like metal-binding protein
MSRLIVWDPDWSLGECIVDRQHRQLVEMVNRLGDVEYGRLDTERMLKLLYYIKLHGETEDQYLRIGGYPGYEQHSLAHDEFYHDLHRRIVGLSANRDEMRGEIARWLFRHIEAESRDAKFRSCVFVNRMA